MSSDRFWARTLQHLPGHAGGSTRQATGIETVRGTDNTIVERVQLIDPSATKAHYTDAGIRASLIQQIAAAKRSRT